MNVTVKNLPSHRVAYLRNVGPYGPDGAIPSLWLRLARWASARDPWTPDRICIGTAIDDPVVTEPDRCRYDAAIVMPAGFEPDGGVNVTDVPGGKHAGPCSTAARARSPRPGSRCSVGGCRRAASSPTRPASSSTAARPGTPRTTGSLHATMARLAAVVRLARNAVRFTAEVYHRSPRVSAASFSRA